MRFCPETRMSENNTPVNVKPNRLEFFFLLGAE